MCDSVLLKDGTTPFITEPAPVPGTVAQFLPQLAGPQLIFVDREQSEALTPEGAFRVTFMCAFEWNPSERQLTNAHSSPIMKENLCAVKRSRKEAFVPEWGVEWRRSCVFWEEMLTGAQGTRRAS